MNVACGGTLVQDLQSEGFKGSFFPVSPMNHAIHTVKIGADTKIREIFAEEILNVNSYHHQSIKRLGDNLIASARCDDDMIEAIELNSERFVLGVQWHPEALVNTSENQLNLFRSLIKACKA